MMLAPARRGDADTMNRAASHDAAAFYGDRMSILLTDGVDQLCRVFTRNGILSRHPGGARLPVT